MGTARGIRRLECVRGCVSRRDSDMSHAERGPSAQGRVHEPKGACVE